jgi:hypothetical protein
MDRPVIDSEQVRLMYDVLERAKPLRDSDNVFVSVAGERIVTLLVDALYELDPELADPWQHLAPGVPPIDLDGVPR